MRLLFLFVVYKLIQGDTITRKDKQMLLAVVPSEVFSLELDLFLPPEGIQGEEI